MAYDEQLAERVRGVVQARSGVVERKMFGGLAWMLDGNMACAVMTEGLVVRMDPDDIEAACCEPHVGTFGRMGKRPMRGFVLVEPDGLTAETDLTRWIDSGAARAASLPPK